ncbi:MAG: glucose-6-phosphate isomerase [Bacilli bacterium]
MGIRFDYRYLLNLVSEKEINSYKDRAEKAKTMVLNKTGLGSDFLGWVDYADRITNEEINDITNTAKKIREQSEVLLVIGIGGSYLGAEAAIQMMSDYFPKKNELEIIFVGNSLSSTYTKEVLEYVKDKKFSINVISKSGTTTEPAIAFRIFKKLIMEKFPEDYRDRIYVTTDASKGTLRKQAIADNYKSFTIPDDIGGRYSVITAVGLLPIACSNIDIFAILKGAQDAYKEYSSLGFEENNALKYAVMRNILYYKGRTVELFVLYEPKFRFLGEWLKQLFGESEGKNGKGVFPASVVYSTDLHSMGQYVQDGTRNMFETVIEVTDPDLDIIINEQDNDDDGLNYLANKSLDYVNKQSTRGVAIAHLEGQVGTLFVGIERNDPYYFGYLVYFFMFSVAVSGYILGVNPFDQEGVEKYKTNMFALLGKKGYEHLGEEIKKKM